MPRVQSSRIREKKSEKKNVLVGSRSTEENHK